MFKGSGASCDNVFIILHTLDNYIYRYLTSLSEKRQSHDLSVLPSEWWR